MYLIVRPSHTPDFKKSNRTDADGARQHWPVAFEGRSTHTTELFPKDAEGKVALDLSTTLIDTWRAMIALLKTGKVKAIGVSNFSTQAVSPLPSFTGLRRLMS